MRFNFTVSRQAHLHDAADAAKWLAEQPPEQRDGVVVVNGRTYYVVRRKSSISVMEDMRR